MTTFEQQTTPTPAPAPQAAKPAPPMPPPDLREGEIATMNAAALVGVLTNTGASEFQKAKACQRAGELGAREAVPALSALLSNEHLSTYARYGLEPIADPSAADALRAALPKLKGNLLIGVINSIGKRRDAKALPALARLMAGPDPEVAKAAAAAIGSIGGAPAARELQTAVGKTSGAMKIAVADACLICAERMLASGERYQGMKLYAFLSAPEMPKAARLAAMSAIIREETAPGRPR
jgi:HEAT repeat protein